MAAAAGAGASALAALPRLPSPSGLSRSGTFCAGQHPLSRSRIAEDADDTKLNPCRLGGAEASARNRSRSATHLGGRLFGRRCRRSGLVLRSTSARELAVQTRLLGVRHRAELGRARLPLRLVRRRLLLGRLSWRGRARRRRSRRRCGRGSGRGRRRSSGLGVGRSVGRRSRRSGSVGGGGRLVLEQAREEDCVVSRGAECRPRTRFQAIGRQFPLGQQRLELRDGVVLDSVSGSGSKRSQRGQQQRTSQQAHGAAHAPSARLP